MMRWMMATCLLVACGGVKGDIEDTGAVGPGSGTGGTSGYGVPTLTGEDPVIRTGFIYCREGSDTDSGYLFFVEVVADDPQGANDLDSFGGLVSGWAGDGSQVFEDEILVCQADGDCYASFRDGIYSTVTCATSDSFTYTAQAVDRAGNWSEQYSLEWVD